MRRLPSLIALRFFEETARHLSFNRAASALCVTQGAVSRQIKLLEDSLGAQLFERDPKGIRLTAAGAQLLPCIQQAFELIEQGSQRFAGKQQRSRLVVCVPPTFATQWLSPRLGSFLQSHGNTELSVRTEASEDSHCSIRFGRSAAAPRHPSRLLMQERHSLVGAAGSKESLEQALNRLPALHVLHKGERLQLWPDWLSQAGLPARYADNGIEFSTLEQAIHAARKGVGLAIVDLNMVNEELAQGRLVRLSQVEVHGPYGYWLDLSPRQGNLAVVRDFAQWLEEEAGGQA